MTSLKSNVLRVEKLSVSYGEHPVLDNLSFDLGKNEIISVLGPSGVGKTTLFQSIAGFIDIDTGTIQIQGSLYDQTKNKVSYMLQKDLLFEHKTVYDNASLPLVIQGKTYEEIKGKVMPLLQRFGLENTENLYPFQLSGGMRQRVAFLRTFLMGHRIALLDEPFSALDTITRSKMQTWYYELVKELELSTILVTHDIDEAILLSDRVLVLNGKPGKIVKELVIEKDKNAIESFPTSHAFLGYKKEILKYL
ncbi:ABC transporter ATP-binding protein [Erysipelothrix urinaevulpis]|uniref:ABC transporter ATP-binding protein n=1 Tax=Erysipelothrix urinaevulpis TaxID=2683717 RepID=UPI001356AC07|nr:ABC transporter ATP-binding protein [Erysipelothrix urinaevulpis]